MPGVSRQTASAAGLPGAVVRVPAGAPRATTRSPLITEALSPASLGAHLGLPQVARVASFCADPGPAILLTTSERLGLYQSAPLFGRLTSTNPSIAEWAGRHDHVLLDLESALAEFPNDPSAFELRLARGQEISREDLLQKLFDLGYQREEDTEPEQLAKLDGWVIVRGDTVEIHTNSAPHAAGKAGVRHEQIVRAEFWGDEIEKLRLVKQNQHGEEHSTPTEHYSVGPLGDYIPEVAWKSCRLEQLAGRVYLDAPEFWENRLEPKLEAKLWALLKTREVVAFGKNDKLPLPVATDSLQTLAFYRAKLRDFANDAAQWLQDGFRVVVILKHERSGDYLSKNVIVGLPHGWEWRAEAREGQITLIKGQGEGGFIHHGAKIVVVTEDLLYGFQGGTMLRSKRLRGQIVTDTLALAVGDYLIHPEHGIGQFLGLEAREVLGVVRDYLHLRYSNDARIYLPVEQLPLLRRHPGNSDDPPRLSTLGTNEWSKAREKARQNAEELAQKLLVQYAARQATPGLSYPQLPTEWDRAFEANFPFQFTRDQGRAIKDVMRDLEKASPMDRLVSGDVGFGKTEVAVRAAYRVVAHGKQVALLVPTTLLADQHLETLRKRFENTPVVVAGLSRFTTPKEAEAVVKGLGRGVVDIVVGTHRLLSQELKFKNLGLLMIDEEHRFGVMQKEKLKALKSVGSLADSTLTPEMIEALQGKRKRSSMIEAGSADENDPPKRGRGRPRKDAPAAVVVPSNSSNSSSSVSKTAAAASASAMALGTGSSNTSSNTGSNLKPATRMLAASQTIAKAEGIATSLAAVAGNVIGERPKTELKFAEHAVDVLSLSATPIPRTLYMSMVGLRDISHIATPPQGRKPIQTVLTPFDPTVVRDAILMEIERGGKAFFIHDRVASIGRRAQYLQTLVPEARIAVAHGQMRDDDIEEIMMGFENGAFDVLVATTIVESGLDIPEANTILIERADRLGLAQLYQLRGRVGRREKEAFAYLFYPPRPSATAERRLWAIADLSDLGSGHMLAEKDMEIRGIGNILGAEQHGHIQMVSLEVYTELLAEAISKLKGETKVAPPRLAIDLKVDARLTPSYLPEEIERIEYYGRLSESVNLAEISRVERELKSRHGPLTREVQNFLDLARLRVVAQSKNVLMISETMTAIQVTFGQTTLDYDARVLKQSGLKIDVTKYPLGFKIDKRGLKADEYARIVLDVLYAFA
jgi:transcription-repair coupling factor (superfamily II helicase)